MSSNTFTRKTTRAFLIAGVLGITQAAQAAIITVINAGFEDTTGLNPSNEFNFGQPAGWNTIHDPNGIVGNAVGGNGIFLGMLQPNGMDFFNTPAPEGDKVGILFGFANTEGAGEYGIEQTLGNVLEANTQYDLSVEVGNIGSGTGGAGFFDLSGFPGYRVDLLAGGVVIAFDNNSLLIPEFAFSTSTVSFSTGAAHAQLGQSLGIRLVSLNTQQGTADIEVDFDDVILEATAVAVPEPTTMILFGTGMFALFGYARRRNRIKGVGDT